MMSKHSFFKMMKEDMRHKTWMLALSGLGHFLMILVAWLIWRGNMGKYLILRILKLGILPEITPLWAFGNDFSSFQAVC